MQMRAKALAGFSAQKIRFGVPMSTLEEVLAPVYLFHRYQVEAAAKIVGGLNYTYAVRGDGQPIAEIVPAAGATPRARRHSENDRTGRAHRARAHTEASPAASARNIEATREDFHSRTQILRSMAPVEAAADMAMRCF